MNKEKFINKLNEELEELKGKELLYFNMRDSVQEARCTNRIFGIQYALNCARLLDEPQKVKVPAFVAEYVEWCHFEEITLWEVSKSIRGMPEEVWKWLNSSINQDIFARAMLDGYEVEEEPKWVVKVGNLYFCGREDTTAQFVMNTVLGEDESIIKYKNEGTASSVAKNLGGTVEKV